MELLESIRAALTANASPDVREAGAAACRILLAALTTTPGAPLTSAQASNDPNAAPPGSVPVSEPAPVASEALPGVDAPAPAAVPTAPLGLDATTVGAIVGALRGLPPEQLLDLAIMRLRAALPPEKASVPLPSSQAVRFHVVPLPPQWRTFKPAGKK